MSGEESEESQLDEAEEGLFTEPINQQAQRTWSLINAHLQSVGRLNVSTQISQQISQLNKALSGITSFNKVISETIGRMADLVEPVNQVAQLGEQLRSSLVVGALVDLSPLLEGWRTVGSVLDRYGETYKAFISNYLTAFQEVLPRITSNFRPLFDQLSRLQARQLERTLCRYHWWPVPGLPFEFYMGILDLAEQGQSRRINRYICDWFRWNRYRRLGRIVKRWDGNEYFRCRRHIYNQALMAHRRGWYNLTVPALMPLVEGVARDYLRGKHGVTERRGRAAIEEALNRNIPPSVFREELQQALIRFLTSSTFADTDRGDVLPSGYELNRHGVAHSRHLRYGTEANSLRCFLLLETLYQFITDNPDTSWLEAIGSE